MATRGTPQFQNRSPSYGRGSAVSGRLDVELSVSAEMAASDANRFLVGLIVMAIVFALMLPVMALLYWDVMEMKAQIKAEAKDLRKLRKEIREELKESKESK